MSRESRQRRQAEAALTAHRRDTRKRLGRAALIIVLILATCSFAIWKHISKTKTTPAISSASREPAFKLPLSYAELCGLNTNELVNCDIALMNLLCAEGLRGAENLNVSNCLAVLDQMAEHVKFETDRHFYKFLQNRTEYNNSEGYYRMMMMATVLQQDWGIRYNPNRIPQPGQLPESSTEFFANSQDVFIHGLARRNGLGTCSSMPVFYISVGRRLGYPLKLVKARGHLFARWEDGISNFNIEGTSVGFVSHDDEEYRRWPASFTPEEEEAESYLKALTPSQELSVFLSIRGAVLRTAGNSNALGAFAHAYYKDPQSIGNQVLFARAEREALRAGILPKRQALLVELRNLEIPEGPMRHFQLQQKTALQAMLLAGLPEAEIESHLLMLRAELQYRHPSRSTLEPPEPTAGQIAPLQPATMGVEPKPR